MIFWCRHQYDPLTKEELEDFSTPKVRYCKKCNKEKIIYISHICVWKTIEKRTMVNWRNESIGVKYVQQCIKCGKLFNEII